MLQLTDVKVSYGSSVVIRGVHLSVGPHQVVALMGRNGAGKTTLLKAIMGLLPLREGHIRFCGEDISRLRPERRAKKGIAYVPQGRDIFPYLTVEENLLLGLEAHPTRLRKIPDEIYDWFPVLASLRGRKGGELSGGQQQQLAIARALVSRPKLLLLDEPTEGIQPNVVTAIQEVLYRIKEQGDIAVLLVEQRLDVALDIADYGYVLENGAVVYSAPREQLSEQEVKPYLTV